MFTFIKGCCHQLQLEEEVIIQTCFKSIAAPRKQAENHIRNKDMPPGVNGYERFQWDLGKSNPLSSGSPHQVGT